MQENKPVLELKNTGKKVYQKLKLKKSIFHCTLLCSVVKTLIVSGAGQTDQGTDQGTRPPSELFWTTKKY